MADELELAFPYALVTGEKVWEDNPGMTLRDYMACHAPVPGNDKMQSLQLNGFSWEGAYARCNYDFADAMLDARNAKA